MIWVDAGSGRAVPLAESLESLDEGHASSKAHNELDAFCGMPPSKPAIPSTAPRQKSPSNSGGTPITIRGSRVLPGGSSGEQARRRADDCGPGLLRRSP